MLDKFAPDLVIVLERAADIARSLGHVEVGLPHLLLAFAYDSQSYASKMLQAKGLTYALLWTQVSQKPAPGFNKDLEPKAGAEIDLLLLDVIRVARWPDQLLIPSKIVFDYLFSEPVVIGLLLRSIRQSTDILNEALPLAHREMANGSEPSPAGGIPMAEGDFTAAANFALLFARVDAAMFEPASSHVDSRNLLVGLLAEQSGAAGKLLRKAGLTIRHMRSREFEGAAHTIVPQDLSALKFSAGVRRILQKARVCARIHNQSFVTSAHLLWAITSSGKSAARDLLTALLCDTAALKVELQTVFELANQEAETSHRNG